MSLGIAPVIQLRAPGIGPYRVPDNRVGLARRTRSVITPPDGSTGRRVEKSLEDGEDLGSGTLGPGERMDDRPIAMPIPANTDHDVDDLSGHIGR
jgi:hypothetical protein